MLSALPHGPLAPHFAGPFAVLKQTARNAFQLDLPETARRAHCTVSKLKTYHSSTPQNRLPQVLRGLHWQLG